MPSADLCAMLQRLTVKPTAKWDFKGKGVSADDARIVMEAAARDGRVLHVDLSENKLGAAGAQAVAGALTGSTVQFIDIGWNDIGDKGARAIAHALKVSTAVQRVDLRRNGIGPDGVKAVAEVLKENSAVRHISLCRNKIGCNGARAVAQMLQVNSTIQHLNLYSNSIGPVGAQAIADALLKNSTLQHLDLHSNTLGDDGARALVEVVKQNWTIQRLDLSGNGVKDPALLGSLTQLLERNQGGGSAPTAQAVPSPAVAQPSLPPTAPPPSDALRLRLDDVAAEDGQIRAPLAGLFRACGAVLPVEEALRPVAHLVSDCACLLKRTQKRAGQLLQQNPGLAQALDENLASYVLMYTAESYPKEQSVFPQMCQALRAQQRELVKPWVQFIWGLLHALKRLPPSPEQLLYRGCRGSLGSFGAQYEDGQEVTWYAFSSCSATLSPQQYFTGTAGDRVLFHLHLQSGLGRDIRALSWFAAEEEVLLPPNIKFKVRGKVDLGSGLTMVQLEEQGLDEVIVEF